MLDYQNNKILLELAKTHDFCVSGKPKLTVILIHGIAADSSSFSRAIEYLEKSPEMRDIRFVAFDLLGSGVSPTSDMLEYDFKEQLEALNNSIKKLNIENPVVLVGHSMGTMIATRYADKHRGLVRELILISPPIYRPKDIQSPLFKKAMEGFREVIKRANSKILEQKSFNNELKYIVADLENYDYLVNTTKPTTIVYGKMDEIIAPFNIPKVLESNPKIIAIKTNGSHGISHDKYEEVLKILERILNETV